MVAGQCPAKLTIPTDELKVAKNPLQSIRVICQSYFIAGVHF